MHLILNPVSLKFHPSHHNCSLISCYYFVSALIVNFLEIIINIIFCMRKFLKLMLFGILVLFVRFKLILVKRLNLLAISMLSVAFVPSTPMK